MAILYYYSSSNREARATPKEQIAFITPLPKMKFLLMPLSLYCLESEMSEVRQTAAGILAMAESDYMNFVQMAFFRQLLEQQRQQILNNAEESLKSFREAEAESDISDRATQEEQSTLERRFRDRERKLLLKIESALVRIQKKSYGYCEKSDEPIGLLRLIARPTATLSLEEQEKHEKLRRNYQGSQ